MADEKAGPRAPDGVTRVRGGIARPFIFRIDKSTQCLIAKPPLGARVGVIEITERGVNPDALRAPLARMTDDELEEAARAADDPLIGDELAQRIERVGDQRSLDLSPGQAPQLSRLINMLPQRIVELKVNSNTAYLFTLMVINQLAHWNMLARTRSPRPIEIPLGFSHTFSGPDEIMADTLSNMLKLENVIPNPQPSTDDGLMPGPQGSARVKVPTLAAHLRDYFQRFAEALRTIQEWRRAWARPMTLFRTIAHRERSMPESLRAHPLWTSYFGANLTTYLWSLSGAMASTDTQTQAILGTDEALMPTVLDEDFSRLREYFSSNSACYAVAKLADARTGFFSSTRAPAPPEGLPGHLMMLGSCRAPFSSGGAYRVVAQPRALENTSLGLESLSPDIPASERISELTSLVGELIPREEMTTRYLRMADKFGIAAGFTAPELTSVEIVHLAASHCRWIVPFTTVRERDWWREPVSPGSVRMAYGFVRPEPIREAIAQLFQLPVAMPSFAGQDDDVATSKYGYIHITESPEAALLLTAPRWAGGGKREIAPDLELKGLAGVITQTTTPILPLDRASKQTITISLNDYRPRPPLLGRQGPHATLAIEDLMGIHVRKGTLLYTDRPTASYIAANIWLFHLTNLFLRSVPAATEAMINDGIRILETLWDNPTLKRIATVVRNEAKVSLSSEEVTVDDMKIEIYSIAKVFAALSGELIGLGAEAYRDILEDGPLLNETAIGLVADDVLRERDAQSARDQMRAET
jgi:hypothetical protein